MVCDAIPVKTAATVRTKTVFLELKTVDGWVGFPGAIVGRLVGRWLLCVGRAGLGWRHLLYNEMSPWTKCVLSTHPFDLMLIISCTLSAFLKSISNPTKPLLSQTVSPSVQHDVAVDKVRTINVQHTPFIF